MDSRINGSGCSFIRFRSHQKAMWNQSVDRWMETRLSWKKEQGQDHRKEDPIWAMSLS